MQRIAYVFGALLLVSVAAFGDDAKIALADDDIGDVAAGAAADQDLRTRLAGAVENRHSPGRIRAPREDGGGEAGGAGPDNRDVVLLIRTGKLTAATTRWARTPSGNPGQAAAGR